MKTFGHFLKLSFFVGCLFSLSLSQSQDLQILSSSSPVDGCNLTANEAVSVIVQNNSSIFPAFGGDYTLSYTINGNALAQQNPGAPINPNATSGFTFSTTADLSQCGDFQIKAWVDHPSDGNSQNDTLTWTIRNDCTVLPGEVLSDMAVCELANQGTLVLDDLTNGTIDEWIFSTDNGSNWTGTGVAGTTYDFIDLTETTQFGVSIDGGFCPNDTSEIATITVESSPDGGAVTGSAVNCGPNALGDLTLTGSTSSVVQWESSDNDGLTWITIPNTAANYTYDGLMETTWYRVLVEGGACPDVYSDTAIVTLNPLPNSAFTGLAPAFCLNDDGVTLIPDQSGGTFSGPGITESEFDPSAAGPGEHTITYSITDENGCFNDSSIVTVVNASPDPDFTGLEPVYCENNSPVTLVPNESDGIFSGAGVAAGNMFYPEIAPIGISSVTYSITNDEGCSASSMQSVEVLAAPNSTFTADNLILEAQTVGSDITYQWFSCDTNIPIEDATDQMFEVTENGLYGLITSNETCQDTSVCILVFLTNIEENSKSHINIYPNPNAGKFNMDMPLNAEVCIYNAAGKIVYRQNHHQGPIEIQLPESLESGIYLVKVSDEEGRKSLTRLVIRH